MPYLSYSEWPMIFDLISLWKGNNIEVTFHNPVELIAFAETANDNMSVMV